MYKSGALTVVGCGIRAPAQATFEATEHIKRADVVYSLVADPVAQVWIESLNSATESLSYLYEENKPRRNTYADIVSRIVDTVRTGRNVCAVAYGHPGVFAYPLHQAIRELRASDHFAEMLPGVSAEDCLFADLGVDPSTFGCLSVEATYFLLRRHPVDPFASLILWQIGAIAEQSYQHRMDIWNADGLKVLQSVLIASYTEHHIVTVYESAIYSGFESRIESVALKNLDQASISPFSTLYVPPIGKRPYDNEMARILGIPVINVNGAST